MKNSIKFIYTIAFIWTVLSFTFQADAASLFACTNLSYDLATGSTDAKTNGEVTKLQLFLKGQGYLSATANGVFGPATTVAVKSFQGVSGISKTGTVGPLTRIAVQIKSCASVSLPPIPTTTTNTTSNTTSTIKGVTAPASGENLTIGQFITIVWNNTGSNQDIILEDENGVAQGFITSNKGNTNSYAWKTGNIYSSKAQSDVIVQPGTYRIKVRGTTGADQVSGFFTISAQPMVVKYVLPTEVVADGSSSILIYGSGFSSRTTIFFDNRYGTNATRLFASNDGKMFVFAVPDSVSVGTHEIILDNSFGDSIVAGRITVTSQGNQQ